MSNTPDDINRFPRGGRLISFESLHPEFATSVATHLAYNARINLHMPVARITGREDFYQPYGAEHPEVARLRDATNLAHRWYMRILPLLIEGTDVITDNAIPNFVMKHIGDGKPIDTASLLAAGLPGDVLTNFRSAVCFVVLVYDKSKNLPDDQVHLVEACRTFSVRCEEIRVDIDDDNYIQTARSNADELAESAGLFTKRGRK